MMPPNELVPVLLREGAECAIRYLDGLERRSVAPAPDAVARLSRFREPLPKQSSEPVEILRLLDEIGSPATMGMAGGRFFGFVIGGALPVTLAANMVASAWDQNTGLFNVTPATATLEEVALGWMVELFGLPSGTGGAFVTGASVANFTSLAAARHQVLERVGWNVEADGLFGAPLISVVVSAEAHPTLIKALGLLGLGRSRVLTVPTDSEGRQRVDALPRIEGPAIVCLQAGNVNTGAIDPIEPLLAYARAVGAWVHVDGAFGLWAAASPAKADLLRGVEKADSWATDAHKWLNVPYDCGLAFVRDPHSLRAAMAITAEYLPTETAHRNPADYTPELSRRARGVEVWAALRMLGREGIGDLIDRTCRHARRFAEGLEQSGFRVLNDVVLNQVLISLGDTATTERIVSRLQADGTCWCGVTNWQGKPAMRISVSSWATTEEDVEKSLAAILRAAQSGR